MYGFFWNFEGMSAVA